MMPIPMANQLPPTGMSPAVAQVWEEGNPTKPVTGGASPPSNGFSMTTWIIIGIAVLATILLVIFIFFMLYGRKKTSPLDDQQRAGRRREGPREDGRQEYEGGYAPNPARYNKDYGPGEADELDALESQKGSSGLGAPRVIRPAVKKGGYCPPPSMGDKENASWDRREDYEHPGVERPSKGRRVRFEEEQYEDMDVGDLVSASGKRVGGGRKSRAKSLVEHEEGEPDQPEPVEQKLMKNSREGRTIKGSFNTDSRGHYEAPPSVSNPGNGRFTPQAPSSLSSTSPATAKASEGMMRAFQQQKQRR